MARPRGTFEISRRKLLVGGGAAAGLVLAWALWPRDYPVTLRAAPGETLFNAFLKIGVDGRVIVAVPQVELGQGVYTSLPQILADELGADWRTVAVEPAPIHPLYANRLLAEDQVQDGFFAGVDRWAAGEYATRTAQMATGGSTSVRAFEPRMREAGAAARALLMKAAAERWDAEWETLDTAQGFVLNGAERLSFAELAAEAARLDLPEVLLYRGGVDNRLAGESLPRIDLPAKVDGSAQFAGDVRLPDMVYAAVRQGPRGGGRLLRLDEAAADAVPGVLAVFRNPRWAGAAASNWWAANQAVQRMKPAFAIEGPLAASDGIETALSTGFREGNPERVFARGDAERETEAPDAVSVEYAVGLAANAPIETLTATARFTGDRLEVWAPAQAPGFARQAAARAAALSPAQVTLYPMLVGGGYGRKLETKAIEQAVAMAKTLKRPVQLVWSRTEELAQDRFRPAARAGLVARLARNGTIAGWHARIAAPGGPEAATGAAPPYAIPAVAVDHVPVEIGIETGVGRAGPHAYTAFFTESFIDELSRKAGMEPLSYRMQMLGDNPRLARALSTAAALGGWDGGASGSAMGIAAHSAFGSHIGVLVEVEVDNAQRVRVLRAVAAVDCGRVVNPEIVRQVIEGGLIHGISDATARPVWIENGLPTGRTLGSLGLVRLVDSPEITVEVLPSDEEPGGASGLGVPVAAPAIANALFALTGQRLRSLPLVIGSAA